MTIHGGTFHDNIRDDYSNSVTFAGWTRADIYGGDFRGSWSVTLGNVTVYGNDLQLVDKKKRGKMPCAADHVQVLSGRLCDNSKISVVVIRVQAPELKLVADCTGYLGTPERDQAPGAADLLFTSKMNALYFMLLFVTGFLIQNPSIVSRLKRLVGRHGKQDGH